MNKQTNEFIAQERRDLELALERAPMDASLHVDLGALLFVAFDEPDVTQQILERALVLEPRNVDARFWLAKLHFHVTQDFEASLSLLSDALVIDPDRPECWSLRASVKSNLGIPVSDRMQDYERAVQLAPTWISPRYALAYALLHLGEADKARDQLRLLDLSTPSNSSGAGTVSQYFERAVTGRQFNPKEFGDLLDVMRVKILGQS